jgi:hypothetical protein
MRVGLSLVLFGAGAASAVTLSEKAKESGCVGKPVYVTGEMYKCATHSGASSYFNVPGATGTPAVRSTSSSSKAATPAGFPRVDPDTQKGRDDVRRKVLSDELAAEEKLLAETRSLADGAPQRRCRKNERTRRNIACIARLRQTVNVHEKNIEALRKELAATNDAPASRARILLSNGGNTSARFATSGRSPS